MTTDAASENPPESAPLRLRAVLVALAIACVWAFFWGNSRTEQFRLAYPRFQPWLWNFYLTCVPVSLVGITALWWRRRWGFWTLLSAAGMAIVIGVYAMGFSLVGIGILLAIVAVWFAAQPDWKTFQ